MQIQNIRYKSTIAEFIFYIVNFFFNGISQIKNSCIWLCTYLMLDFIGTLKHPIHKLCGSLLPHLSWRSKWSQTAHEEVFILLSISYLLLNLLLCNNTDVSFSTPEIFSYDTYFSKKTAQTLLATSQIILSSFYLKLTIANLKFPKTNE